MNLKNITKDKIVLIHPATYKKYKRELDEIKCRVITGNFVKRDRIIEWNSDTKIC